MNEKHDSNISGCLSTEVDVFPNDYVSIRVESEQIPNFDFSIDDKNNSVNVSSDHEELLDFIIAKYLRIRLKNAVKEQAWNDDMKNEILSYLDKSSDMDILGLTKERLNGLHDIIFYRLFT